MRIHHFEDCILRLIFNNLSFLDLKRINIINKQFNNLKYINQCLPHGIYQWIYGIRTIENENYDINKKIMRENYNFINYVNDIITFLDDTVLYYDSKLYYKCDFKTYNYDKYGNIILLHDIYNITIEQYYKYVRKSLRLRALLF